MTKVQLSLTDQEAAILAGYGEQFGYSLAKVAKFFISKAMEKRGLEALAENRAGKTKEITDVDSG